MPELHLDDTIAAIATPPGEGGIGIVRLSGPQAIQIASQMFEGRNDTDLRQAKTHTIHFGRIRAKNGKLLDQALASVFKSPASYTGEDVVELSAHGSLRVLRNILNLALSLGARHAEPGEFTRRAFLSGRIDLAQAEAVLDLIRAKTDESARAALRQLEGTLSEAISQIKTELMRVSAHLEAYLDFPDEHLEVYSGADFFNRFASIEAKLEALISTYSKGELLREGALVVIVGRANVGKSSLLNALLKRDRAIVSDLPGTTRDLLEESLDLEGVWARLVDTAGFTASDHPLDRAGMERTKRCFEKGNLFLWLLDGAESFRAEDEMIEKELAGKRTIPVINKIDAAEKDSVRRLKDRLGESNALEISARTGGGIENLKKAIHAAISENNLGEESVLVTRLRHKRALEMSLEALKRARAALEREEPLECAAVDLKESLDSLRELVGEIYSEDLLDVIFSEFCIGK